MGIKAGSAELSIQRFQLRFQREDPFCALKDHYEGVLPDQIASCAYKGGGVYHG